MNQEQKSVEDFHIKYGHRVGTEPGFPNDKILFLRMRLMSEEGAECQTALANKDLVDLADGLVDLLYVTYGTAVSFGIDLEPLFAEVHRSNMTKSEEKDEGGKSVKGSYYDCLQREAKLRKQGWKG